MTSPDPICELLKLHPDLGDSITALRDRIDGLLKPQGFQIAAFTCAWVHVSADQISSEGHIQFDPDEPEAAEILAETVEKIRAETFDRAPAANQTDWLL